MKQKHGLHPSAFLDRYARRAVPGLIAIVLAAPVMAQETHHHRSGSPAAPSPPVFVASTAKPFAALMDDAMEVMDDSMRRAPMNGVAEHDFITMMIPHHQGAIDMAKALLLNTKDPELINLAQASSLSSKTKSV